MKPSALHRTKGLNPSGWLDRRTPLAKVNRKRRKRREAEGKVYGPYHKAMSTMDCILKGHPLHQCYGPICGHHLKRVANGGEDRGNEVPVCVRLHAELHFEGDGVVEAKYEVDLNALAARLAVELRP